MKIAFLGDFVLSDLLKIDKKIVDILQQTDFNVANLEAPFIEQDYLSQKKSGLYQKSNTDTLHKLNIKIVSLANNHISDFGIKGMQKTIEVLEKNNIKYFGAGQNIQDALKPATIKINNTTISFWGFMLKFHSSHFFATQTKYGIPELKQEMINNILKKSSADIKILFNHWSQEFEDYPEPICRDIAEKTIKNCNLIIGSHPHCIQGIQQYQTKNIFYSLGNFTMPYIKFHKCALNNYPKKSDFSFFPIVNFDNNSISYKIYPIQIKNGYIISLANEKNEKLIREKIKKISKPLQDKSYKEYRKFYNKNKKRKFRPTLKHSSLYNKIIMTGYKITFKTIILLTRLLDIIGLREFAKRMFNKILKRSKKNR